ncbi:MAG: superoxide dismutase, partial [Candidatus Limnocylindrales bacterium]
SNNQQLAVIPLGRFGRLPDPSKAKLLPLTGDYVVGSGFNANGIVARGGWLITDQTNTGKLFRIDPRTGATRLIDTGGYTVANGDGLALRNGRLYAVRNQDNLVAVLTLGSDLLSASLVGEITSVGNLDVPTTATFALDRLWVVNARFNTTPTSTTPYWITRLPLNP